MLTECFTQNIRRRNVGRELDHQQVSLVKTNPRICSLKTFWTNPKEESKQIKCQAQFSNMTSVPSISSSPYGSIANDCWSLSGPVCQDLERERKEKEVHSCQVNLECSQAAIQICNIPAFFAFHSLSWGECQGQNSQAQAVTNAEELLFLANGHL